MLSREIFTKEVPRMDWQDKWAFESDLCPTAAATLLQPGPLNK
jgi:hypothetical protein